MEEDMAGSGDGGVVPVSSVDDCCLQMAAGNGEGDDVLKQHFAERCPVSLESRGSGGSTLIVKELNGAATSEGSDSVTDTLQSAGDEILSRNSPIQFDQGVSNGPRKSAKKTLSQLHEQLLKKASGNLTGGNVNGNAAVVSSIESSSPSIQPVVCSSAEPDRFSDSGDQQSECKSKNEDNSISEFNSSENNADALSDSLCGDQRSVVVDGNSHQSAEVNRSSVTTASKTDSRSKSRKAAKPVKRGQEVEPLDVDMPDVEICCTCNPTVNCASCSFTCCSEQQLVAHETDCHGASAQSTRLPFICRLCKYMTDNRFTFQCHMAHHPGQHTVRYYLCPYCKFDTNDMMSIEVHISGSHSAESFRFEVLQESIDYLQNLVECPVCREMHRWRQGFLSHVVRAHDLKSLAEHLEANFAENTCPSKLTVPQRLFGNLLPALTVSKDCVVCEPEAVDDEIAAAACGNKSRGNKRADISSQAIDDDDSDAESESGTWTNDAMEIELCGIQPAGASGLTIRFHCSQCDFNSDDYAVYQKHCRTHSTNSPSVSAIASEHKRSVLAPVREISTQQVSANKAALQDAGQSGAGQVGAGGLVMSAGATNMLAAGPLGPKGIARTVYQCHLCPFECLKQVHYRRHLAIHERNECLVEGYGCGYCHFTHNRLNCVKFHLGKYHGDQPIKMSRIIEGAAIELSEVELFALRSRRSYGSDGGSSRSSAPTMVPMVNAIQADIGKLFDSTLTSERNSSSRVVSSKRQPAANDKSSAQSEHDILDAFEQQLPAQMIYTDPVKCPCCDFTNRVRINLIRHLKLHKDETDYVGDVTTVDVDSVSGLAGSLLAAAAGEVDANTNDSSSTISTASQPSHLLAGTAEKPLLRRILNEKPILLKNEEMGHQSNAGVDDDLSPGSLSKQQELPKTSFASSSSQQQQQQDYSEFCSKLSHTDQYKCHRCSFTNRFPSKVKRHFYYRHAKVPPYRCGHCPFEAVERGKVARHSQLVHRSLPVVVLQQEVELAPDNGGSNSTGTDFQSESGLKSPEFVANQIFPEDLDLATAIVKSEPVDADSEDAPLIDYYPKVEIWNDESTVDQNSQGAVSQTGSAASEMKADLSLPTRPSGSGSRMCRRKFCCGHCGVVSRWNRRDIILHVMHVHVKRRVYTCRHCSFGNSKSKALVRAHCVKFHPTRSVSVRDNTALLNCVVADEGTDGIVTMVFAPNNKPLYDDVSIAQYLAKYKLQTIDNGGGGAAQGSPPDLVDSGVGSHNFPGVKLSFSAVKKSSSSNEPNFKIAGLEKAPMGFDDQTLMAEALTLHAQPAGHRDEGRPWKCRQCGFVHSRIVRVKYHLLCRHLNLKPFSCPYCNLYLWKSQSVLSHVDKCHPGMERRAVATVDEKAAYLRRNIERVSSAHSQPRQYRSSLGAAGGSLSMSNAGEVAITAPAPGRPNLFRCKLCGYQDPRNDKTKYHIIKQHLKLRQFSCPYCHVYLWGRQQVAKHVAEQHPGYEIRIQRTFHEYEQFLRNNICKIDATRGHAVESYRLPPPSHAEQLPVAELSPSGSVTDDQLKTINRMSTLVARLPCDLCSFVTDSELSLSAHRRSHRLFQCAHCRFRHVLVAKVQSHCLSAHPSKPVHYKQWTPTMKPSSSPHNNNNNNSNGNSLIESGTNAVASSLEPPFQKFYPCDLCPAHFVSQPELDDHVVGAHSGVFRCAYCLLVMTSKDGMMKHQLDEHGCDVPAVDVVLPHREAASESPVHGKRSPIKRAAEPSDLENMAGVGGKNAHLDVAAVASDLNGFQSSNDANSARFKCRLCHYGCFKLTVMRHHVMSHLRYHPFICPYCSMLRSVKSFPIKKHVRLKHPGCEERVLFVQNDVLERKVKSSFYRVKAQQTVAVVPASQAAGDADNETDDDEVEVIDEEADDEPPMLVKEVASPVATAATAAAAPIVQPTMTNPQSIQLAQAGQHKVLYQCKLCGLRTHIRMDMRHHLMREIHYKPYKCAYCPYTEPCRWSMRKHFRTRHAGVDVALIDLRDPEQDRKIEQLVEECSIPLKDVTDRDLLSWKPRVVSPQRGIVSRLTTFAAIRPSSHAARGSASSSSSSSLAATSSTDDVTSSKKVKSRLVTSELLTGTSLRLHRCTQCSYTTSNVKLLRGHLVKHGPCRLQCAYCDYRGHYPSRIYKHIRRHHRGCGFRVVKVHDDVDVRHPTTSPTAVRKSAAQLLLLPVAKPAAAAAAPSRDEPLKLHRRARPLPGTVYLDGVALDVSLTTDQLGRFQCNECGYHTTNREHYKMHVVIHRPPNWQCFYCDQKYPLVFRLRRHSHSRHPNLPIKWIDLLTGQVCVDSRQTDTGINGVPSQQQIVVISDQNSTTANVRKPLKNTARKSTTPRIKVALFRSHQHRMKALRQIGAGRRDDDGGGGETSDCVESDDELLVIEDSDAAGSRSEMDVSSSDAESAPDVCFCCHLCTYSVQSTSPSALGRHVAEAHAGQLPPVELVMAGESDDVESLTLCRCSLCPYESFTQPDFEEHILTEHGLARPFVCGTCDRFASFSRAAVADHARSTHGGDREELAVPCNRPFVMLPVENVENNGDGRSSSHFYNFNARVMLANVLKWSVNKFDRVLSSYGVVMSDNSIL